VKRATKYLLGAALLAAVGALVGAVAWLAGTTAGARWLLDTVSRHSQVKIVVRQVEGRILDHLRVAGVRVVAPQQEVEIDSLELRWQPFILLTGRVAVNELALQGVRVRDNTPASGKPPELAWPGRSGLPAQVDGRIEVLRVDGLTYRHLDEKPVIVTKIAASFAWSDQLISLVGLDVVAPVGRVTGNMAAGFRAPSLRLDLAVTPAQPVAGMNQISFQARLRSARTPEQLAGSVTVSGTAGAKKLLELAGEVGMTHDSFNLRQLRLTGPGLRGTASGEGTLQLTAAEPLLTLKIGVTGLQLDPALRVPTNLSGNLSFAGNLTGYRGRFDLANRGKGWQSARLAGSFQGDAAGVRLALLEGSILDGSVRGDFDVGWRDGIALRGGLHGRGLNPAVLAPDWVGVANLDLTGNAAWSKSASLRGEVSGNFLESRLHGKALTGEVRASFAGDTLRIDRLALRGKGFDINAKGELDKRLAFSAQVSDLSRLVPRTSGELSAEGWVRRREGSLSGSATARGKDFIADGVRMATVELAARLDEGKEYPLHATAALSKVVYDRFRADSVTLEVAGTLASHTVVAALRSNGAEARVALAGAYLSGGWQGEISSFSGHDQIGPWKLEAPAALAVAAGKVALASLVITGSGEERLEVAGELTDSPPGGFVRAQWGGLNLARLNPWLNDVVIIGAGAGNVKLRMAGELLTITGSADAHGTVTAGGRQVTVQQSLLSVDGGEHGMRAGIEVRLADGVMLKGTFSSSTPARPALPEEGDLAAEWAGLDLALLRPFLPSEANLEGSVSGRLTGKLLPESRLDLRGTSTLARGKVRWQRPEGELNVNLRSADLSWIWRGETLRGDLTLALAEYGEARGNFQLPLPARFPVSIDAQGAVQASLTGKVGEKGVLSSFFPGFIRESHGELDVELRVGGRWEEPKIEGNLRLTKAGAYLPAAGINIKDVQLTAHLEKDSIRIDAFRAVSGPGHIEGTAVLQLKEWHVTGYRGSLNGERFQIIYHPELQLLGTPRLTFEGTPEKLTVRGEMRLPELIVSGPPARPPVTPSKDVIIEGAPLPAGKAASFALDVQVRVELGDRVLVKAEGIDAQLGGSVELTLRNLDNITSRGEIKVVKGRYHTYGVNLEIVRGRLFYSGGPFGRPTLDFLALRTVGEVRAGVTVGGTPHQPVIKLYSEPTMPDVDILAYVVLGHPLSSSTEQAGLVAQAAGFLLSSGQSVSLQDQIKKRLGISTLDFQTAAEVPSYMGGYKPLPVTPPGAAPTKAATGISQAMVTVGKYLTPKLYVSYGRSVFTGDNQFRLRYDIFRQWQIETQAGTASGADLYYKIEFN
jgi:translocation and assembly module TamB